MTEYIFAYLIAVNLISAALSIIDKHKAKKGLWRIPEATLIALAVAGGALGEYLTMRIIRHKTKHVKFMLGLPLIIIVQILILAFTALKTAQII